MEAQDENVVISFQIAQGCFIGAREEVETVLRVMFPKMHEIERRTGQAVPQIEYSPENVQE